MRTLTIRSLAALALLLSGALLGARPGFAHCDGLDGPVVEAGRQALESGDVRHALVWVLPDDEPEVQRAFEHALEVRGLGEEARELADHFFFETLVRVHRAGEGEPYTGLKAAGRDLGPVIPAADRALASGSLAEVEAVLVEAVRHGLRERFAAAVAEKGFDPADVSAGRRFVAAYVPFLHYAEGVYAATAGAVDPHGDVHDAAPAAAHGH